VRASTRDDALALDAGDSLAHVRTRFVLPPSVIYLDGNSLGALPRGVTERVHDTIEREWGHDLISSWNEHGWWDAPRRIGARLARFIGAEAGEVVVSDSTSVNLYKLLHAAISNRAERSVLLTERHGFPTDRYVIDSVARERGLTVEACEPGAVLARIDERVAVVALTHVDYRTGRRHDLEAVTATAHEAGALVVWDLCHSVGAMPLDVDRAGVDYAVGCTYKYLNGGPGAPAFAFVAHRHQARFAQPIAGWHGHARPFAMEEAYAPAAGASRLLTGTPPILSLVALEAALGAFEGVDLHDVRAKSVALSEWFITLVDERVPEATVVSPRDAGDRGSHVSVAHPSAYAVVQALAARGVIGDYREPDVMRFGVAPLYTRFVDVWDAVDRLVEVLRTQEWRRPEHQIRRTVT
jgi:kynureninase